MLRGETATNRTTAVAFTAILACASTAAPRPVDTDVLVVGGGTGGIGAALQSARLGRSSPSPPPGSAECFRRRASRPPTGTIASPETVDGLVVADKAISVEQRGQRHDAPAAGRAADGPGRRGAGRARRPSGREPRAVSVRDVQGTLLEARTFLLPYLDVPPDHPQFARIQRIGATGILKGKGVPYQWANQTWFYPDFPIDAATLAQGLAEFEKVEGPAAAGRPLTVAAALTMLHGCREALLKKVKGIDHRGRFEK